MPDWIELKGPHKTAQQGLAWTFTLRTDKPGKHLTTVAFECDTGVGRCQVSVEILDARPGLGDLVFCDSPFDCHTDHPTLSPLVRIVGALRFRVHCLESLARLGDVRPRTILLHQSGLLKCGPDEVRLLRRLAWEGVNVVVMADEFFRGTTGAANRVLAPFGLRMKQDGRDEPGLTREERLRRIVDWQARYDQAPFDSGPAHIAPHPLTRGVQRVRWFRPCPIVCEDGSALPLVANAADAGECFAAAASPGGHVMAVGTSLWSGLSGTGWLYHNDRFLANLLAGGDAEEVVAETPAAVDLGSG